MEAGNEQHPDIGLAGAYIRKSQFAKDSGIDFKLSFTSYKNMMRAKRCKLTGIELTTKRKGKSIRATDRTIDRIDCSKGYVSGNVIACCHAANQLKSMFENDCTTLSTDQARKVLDVVDRVKSA